MSNHVYKTVEITGSSPNTIEEAVDRALVIASNSVRDMRWFEVTDIRGHIEDGRVGHYQVTLKIGFTIEASQED